MAATENAVELQNVVKRYGEFTAVKRIDLTVSDNSFVTFLGPSGCGKTTVSCHRDHGAHPSWFGIDP